jgi:hypothetical protein
MDTKRHAHLLMILDIINRFINNSFLIKGWTVVLVAALFALASDKSNSAYFIYLAFLPVIAFWVLDGYYLWQERIYRKLYDHILDQKEKNIDFSLDTTPFIQIAPSWFFFNVFKNIGNISWDHFYFNCRCCHLDNMR